jgi:uncharacterized protein YacL
MCQWCATFFEWIWDEFWASVSQWISDTFRRCSRRRCRWWCLCCNRWLCWIGVVLVAILAFLLTLILSIIAIIACALCYIVCIILCILGLLFGNTETDACIEKWCQGLPRESDEEPPVDPQKTKEPGQIGLVGGGGGVSPGSSAPR